jgi:hypothetical protein
MVSYIGNTVIVPVPNIAEVLVDFDTLSLYRGSVPAGPFTDLVTSFTLEAGRRSYSYQDTDGQRSSWYQSELSHSVSGAISQRSPPWPAAQGEAVALRQLVRDTAERAGLLRPPRRQRSSPGGACGTVAAGTTASIIRLTEYGSSLFASTAFKGSVIHLNDGPLAGQEREVNTFVVTSGVGYFTLAEDFGSAPAAGVTADIYALVGTDDIRNAINAARTDIWIDRTATIIGTPDTLEYSLPSYFASRAWLTGVTDRLGDDLTQYRYTETGLSGLISSVDGALVYRNTIPENRVLIVSGYAHPDPLESMTEEVNLTDDLRDYWVLCAATELAWRLRQSPSLTGRDREDWSKRAVDLENERKVRAAELGMRPSSPNPFVQDMVYAGGDPY